MSTMTITMLPNYLGVPHRRRTGGSADDPAEPNQRATNKHGETIPNIFSFFLTIRKPTKLLFSE